MTRLLAVLALAACAPAPRPPLPAVPDLDRIAVRVESLAHAEIGTGVRSWWCEPMSVGIHPLKAPRGKR
jgi:hypothetical protein